MMTRTITSLTLVLATKTVTVVTLVAFGDVSMTRYYEVADSALVNLAQSKNLDTWAESEVCELIDQIEEFQLLDPVTQEPVVTTYVGQP